MEYLAAGVVIDGANGSFDKCYSYSVPETLRDSALPGCRVTVPFGRGNTKKQGMILNLFSAEDISGIKEILSVIDSQPVLNDEMLKMCEWMHSHLFCSYFDAVHAMLPAGIAYSFTQFYCVNEEFTSASLLPGPEAEIYEFIKARGETPLKKIEDSFENADDILDSLVLKQAVIINKVPVRRMKDLTRRWVRMADCAEYESVRLTPRQREVVEIINTAGSVSVKELRYFTGVSESVINSLLKKGIIESFEKQEFRMPYRPACFSDKPEITLTKEQAEAFSGLREKAFSGKSETALLYGVTGSGKTCVFLKLTDAVTESGRGVIIMVPEIALTPQMIKIFSDRYGSDIAVFHSAMSIGQRMDEYNRIKQGKAHIAIGTRSAVFAPFSDLGLIIIDEEQEHTYKSEKSPRYHARDLAHFRAAYHKCMLCLASATPSVESYSAAKSGKYSLFTLFNRYGNASLPEVSVVDMRKELKEGNSSDISRRLAYGIEQVLDSRKQAIILLNRRGHNTYVSCMECGYVFGCDECSISLTYHSANRRLMCHYCGKSVPMPKKCPQCQSDRISFSGTGTQKLEEELRLLFPKARILRLDADSTVTRDSYSVSLTAFANGEYDIMIGTQMVAKGLDFPNVTLVGVVGADKSLCSDDYRSFERTFSLLTQVIGRAGRANDRGIAVIQTNDPAGNVIELAAKQDYDSFYKEEIANRKLMIFPPFCDICVLWTSSCDRNLAQNAVNNIFEAIKLNISGKYCDVKLIILGPCPASVLKVGGKYRFRMVIKCRNNARFREMINNSLEIKKTGDISVGIDINPETII